MDLKKHIEFFNPMEISDEIHIIGLGAIGSHVAEMLTRMGFEKLHLYDFDTVSEHNLANQMFFANQSDAQCPKTEALFDTCDSINPDIKITLHKEGYVEGMRLSGYIFLCVDNIDLRRDIVKEHQYNVNIKAMLDFRMGLEDGQHYAADWSSQDSIKNLLSTMDFTHDEAKEAMPVSACGLSLNVIPTIRILVSVGISNWMNFIKGRAMKKIIFINAFQYTIDTF